jgi:hypothetical protein
MPWCHWFDSIGIDIRMIQYGTFTKSGKRVGARLGDPLCGIKYIMHKRHDIQHNATQHNDIQHNNTQHKNKKSLC